MTTFYSRADWDAQPLGPVSRFTKPDFIFVHHTTGATMGRNQSDDWVRQIDKGHKAKGWAGIGYSFLFDSFGQIFEGRGWGVVGAHTEGWNSKGHGFAFLGNGDERPSDEALEALRWLIAESDRRYGATKIEGHRDTKSTHCPGNSLYGLLPDLRGGSPAAPVTGGANLGAPGVLPVTGNFGPLTIRALQASLNDTGANPRLATDGVFGKESKKALQRRLNHTNGPVDDDGKLGPQTVRALQAHVGASVDGDWGAETTRKLQESLNAKRF